MADLRTRSVPLGFPTLVGTSGVLGMLGVGGAPWQVAVSCLLAAILLSTDVVRGWSGARDRVGSRDAS